MLKSRLLPGLIFMISAFAACEKPEVYNADVQYAIDEAKILKWSDSTKIALTKHNSGLYYQIIKEGDGTADIELSDTLSVQYEGKFLTDTIFSSATDDQLYKFVLDKSIPGWKIGLPLVKEGGKIRLLIASTLAYQDYPVSGIPLNSSLDFTVEIKKVSKKVVN